jgi:hypothetical protein
VTAGSVPCGIAVPQDCWNRPATLEPCRDFVRVAEPLPFDSLWVQEQIVNGRRLRGGQSGGSSETPLKI